MKKNTRGSSSSTNKFTPSQLDHLKKLAESQSNKEVISKEEYCKSFTKTTNLYPLRGVYILEFEDGIKIGMSKNIKERLKAYNKPWCKPILQSIYFYYEDFQDLELEILKKSKKYIDFTVKSNEWITGISFDDFVSNVDKITRLRDCQNQAFKSFMESNL